MQMSSARSLALLCAALALPLGCDSSKTALSHDGSAASFDGPLGSGGGTGGSAGTGGMGTGGSSLAAGTGGNNAGTGGSAPDAGTGGSDLGGDAGAETNAAIEAGSDGNGADGSPDGASADAGVSDAPTTTTCPNAPPADGDTCTAARSCFYEDCAGVGRTVATCGQGTWSVTSGPCDTVVCENGITGTSCDVGKVCVAIASGVPVNLCVPNSCGTGPVSCDCVESCIGSCSVRGTVANGIVIDCNPCSPDGCV